MVERRRRDKERDSSEEPEQIGSREHRAREEVLRRTTRAHSDVRGKAQMRRETEEREQSREMSRVARHYKLQSTYRKGKTER